MTNQIVDADWGLNGEDEPLLWVDWDHENDVGGIQKAVQRECVEGNCDDQPKKAEVKSQKEIILL